MGDLLYEVTVKLGSSHLVAPVDACRDDAKFIFELGDILRWLIRE